MLIQNEYEQLEFVQQYGVKKVNLDTLIEKSARYDETWKNDIVDNAVKVNFKLDDRMRLLYTNQYGEERVTDITQHAFTQLCGQVSLPAKYIKKCFNEGKAELAMTNFQAWADSIEKSLMIKEYNGVARAVLGAGFKTFSINRVLRTLKNTVDTEIYKPSQAFISPDRLHVRFVNYNPININGESSPIYNGFTVDTSDVGRGSLNMKFFLYRSVCQNGMVVRDMGGTLFSLKHAGQQMTDGKLATFSNALQDIETLTEQAADLIRVNKSRMLKEAELQMYLEKAKKDLKLSDKSQERLTELMKKTYDSSKWGLMNSMTELAQDFTLEQRVKIETFAGSLLTELAA